MSFARRHDDQIVKILKASGRKIVYTRTGLLDKRKTRPPSPYSSFFELEIHLDSLGIMDYEKLTVEYKVHKEYTPDFIHPDIPHIWFESKGRFREAQEAAKYTWIRKYHPESEIVFIFQKAGIAFPFAKKRKDGTRKTLEEWCTKNDFRYTYADELDQFIRGELGI